MDVASIDAAAMQRTLKICLFEIQTPNVSCDILVKQFQTFSRLHLRIGGGCLKLLYTTYVIKRSSCEVHDGAVSPPSLMFLFPGLPGISAVNCKPFSTTVSTVCVKLVVKRYRNRLC